MPPGETRIPKGKLQVPPPPLGQLERKRLTGRLSGAPKVRVTTIVAPAGYGKTVLVTEWSRTPYVQGRRFAYVSLDPGDNDPMRLWSSLLVAARSLGADLNPGIDAALREELRESGPAMPQGFLASVVAALEDVPDGAILVLDDLQLVENTITRAGIAYVVDRLPPAVHLVLTSRSPITDLSLHRLRVRDELDELDAADLAFTEDESAQFIRQATWTDMEDSSARELMRRTEGWVTGLKIALLAMPEGADPDEYVNSVAGDSRKIAEFLLGEVLSRQAPDLQSFLVETSILSTLTAGACDAVTGRDDSAAQLRTLEAQGIFVVALDDSRDRYRYQALFAEFLRGELVATEPERVPELHRSASRWYEQSGDAVEAVEHALRARDYERAVTLMVALTAEDPRRGLDPTVAKWLRELPEEQVSSSPELAMQQAWICLLRGELLDALRWCERADRGSGGAESTLVESSCARCFTYRTLGDLEAAIEWGTRAQALLDSREPSHRYEDAYARLAMTDAIAEAYGLMGQPQRGIALLSDSLRRTREGGNDFAAAAIPGKLASLSSSIGRFNDAAGYAEQSLAAAERLRIGHQPPAADAQLALGELHWERDDLKAAEQWFVTATETASPSQRTWVHARALLGLAHCRFSRRATDEALAILAGIEDIFPWGEPPAFLRAQVVEAQLRLRCAAGDADGARKSLQRLGEVRPGGEKMPYLVGSVLLCEGRAREAMELIAPVAEIPQYLDLSTIESNLLLARSAAKAGERTVAMQAISTAIRAGESQRFIRSLVQPAAGMVGAAIRPLSAGSLGGPAPDPEYLRQLDQATRSEQGRIAGGEFRASRPALSEPLTEGELAVIAFLPSEFTYAEIATTRFVSVNTIKSQLKSIYRKLGVTSRVAAIERCRELDLL